MKNISITIEMYVESWVIVGKLVVQCDHRLLLPPFLIASAIGRLNYWWIFLSVYPMNMTLLLLKDLRCLHITLNSWKVSSSCCPNCIIKKIEVTGIRTSVFLSVMIRDIFIEITSNRICCLATSPILLNSELFPTE